MFPQCSIYYSSNTSTEKEHQVFSLRGKFSTNTNVIVCSSYYSPFLLLETSGFSELLWAPTPGPPLRLCPGDLTAPPDPQLARAMTFACRHDIVINPTNFWWWWFEGGSHEIFTNREGGSTIFLLLPGGDQKFNRVFHPVSTTPPRELKNDNSLNNIDHFRPFRLF